MMKRVVLNAQQKQHAMRALPVWEGNPIQRSTLEGLSQEFAVHAKDAYATLLHMDTLFAISQGTPLVWKGGTAIQSLLPPSVQRISVDLDFNSTTANTEIVREAIQECNQRLADQESIVTIKTIPFGAFYEAKFQPEYRMIEFRRVLPTLFDELVEIKKGTFKDQPDDIRIQARLSRVQINLGHHQLPALHPTQGSVEFFTQTRIKPSQEVVAKRASVHDLVADKILATTRHDGFGRERFKDLYDLIALRHLDTVDLAAAQEKLRMIGGQSKSREYVEGSLETLRILSLEREAAQGFATTVCKQGKTWVQNWEDELNATINWLLPLT